MWCLPSSCTQAFQKDNQRTILVNCAQTLWRVRGSGGHSSTADVRDKEVGRGLREGLTGMGVPGSSMCQGTEGRERRRGPGSHREFTGPASESSGRGDAGEGAGGGMDQVTGGQGHWGASPGSSGGPEEPGPYWVGSGEPARAFKREREKT